MVLYIGRQVGRRGINFYGVRLFFSELTFGVFMETEILRIYKGKMSSEVQGDLYTYTCVESTVPRCSCPFSPCFGRRRSALM